jgi:hypothetical protein
MVSFQGGWLLIEQLVYKSVPIFYHFLNIPIMADRGATIITAVHRINDGFIPLKERIVEQIQKLHPL